jgi:hypothetical protein
MLTARSPSVADNDDTTRGATHLPAPGKHTQQVERDGQRQIATINSTIE